jgi:hypothetical protein
MFTAEERDLVRNRLLARAEADVAITGAALTGSHASGDADHWSDTDLVLAVRGELAPVADRWTRWLYQELGAQHHWDLTAGAPIIRVFLLPGWLEIDLTFAAQDRFGPRGPSRSCAAPWPPPSTSRPANSSEPIQRSRPACGLCSPNWRARTTARRGRTCDAAAAERQLDT